MPPEGRAEQPSGMANDMLNQAGEKIRTFRRSRSDRMIAGVCGGAAELLGVDAAILRVLLVAATLFGFGAGALI